MARVKKWVWRLEETGEVVEVQDHVPPIRPAGLNSGIEGSVVTQRDLDVAAVQGAVITKHEINHATFPPTERVEMLFPGLVAKHPYPLRETADGPVVGWSNDWGKALPQPVPLFKQEPPEFKILDHPYVGGKFTIFVLGYGDHHQILERCVGSILDTCAEHRYDLRIALNQPTERLERYATGIGATKVYIDRGDRKKYPAMRAMFWDKECPIETPYVCWFDDDSWCRKKDWMVRLTNAIVANHPHQGRLYGAKYTHDLMPYRKNGHRPEEWFKSAAWWRGRHLYAAKGTRLSPNGAEIVFASGGFWALATHVIREANIPDERLNHNGGDITIGCQVTQAGYKVVDFSPRPNKEVIAWSDHARRGYHENFPWAT